MRAYFNLDNGSFTAINEYNIVVNLQYGKIMQLKKSDGKVYFQGNIDTNKAGWVDNPNYERGYEFVVNSNSYSTYKGSAWLFLDEEAGDKLMEAIQGNKSEIAFTPVGTQRPPRPASQPVQEQEKTQTPSSNSTSNSTWNSNVDIALQILQKTADAYKNTQSTDDYMPDMVGENMGTPEWVRLQEEKKQRDLNNQTASDSGEGLSTTTIIVAGSVAVAAIYFMTRKR